MTALFNNESVVVTETHTHTLTAQLKGFPASQAYKNGMDRVLEAISERSTTRLIIDMRELKPPGRLELEWYTTTWLPKLAGSGVTHLAIVKPQSVTAQLAIDQVKHAHKAFSKTATFESVAEAERWTA